jgi:hypothetical protein
VLSLFGAAFNQLGQIPLRGSPLKNTLFCRLGEAQAMRDRVLILAARGATLLRE